jgi:hypothetical protein
MGGDIWSKEVPISYPKRDRIPLDKESAAILSPLKKDVQSVMFKPYPHGV